MLPKLKDTPKFKKDLNKFRKIIESIKDPKIKDQGKLLLSDVLNQSYIIDQGHNPVANNDIDPRQLREQIEKLGDARVKLKKFIKDYLDALK